MNRRTVLQSAGVLATVGLAGCIEGVQEHFEGSFQGIVPIEIHSEASQSYNIRLEAHERETGRQSYEEAYSVPPEEMVTPPHLERTAQSLRIVTSGHETETNTLREVSITPGTELVLIYLRDDDLLIDVQRGESDGERNETDAERLDEGGPEGNETDVDEIDEQSSDADVERDDENN
ncbi:hypothetical protein ACLI4Z_15345 [Natrialbaceae archaeon A-arb3/5]